MSIELPNEFHPLLADYDPSDLQSYQAVWATFRGLPEFSRNLLTSDELPLALRDLSVKFDFTRPMIMFVSVMVRKIVFREWGEDRSRAELTAWCREFDPKNASRSDEILEAVKKDVLTIIPRGEESTEGEKRSVARMTLLEALSQYSQLGQQTITETRIKLKASVEPVRGSLINWLKCYREELGVGYHDAMLRGQFLFRSQNGAKLTDEERERIEILLRSIEDREIVAIDTEHQTLVFPSPSGPKGLRENRKTVTAPVPGFVPERSSVDTPMTPSSGASQEKAPPARTSGEVGSMHVSNGSQFSPSQQTIGTLHFSSKHVLPVEKEIGSKRGGILSDETRGVSLSGKSDIGLPASSGFRKVVSSVPQPQPAGPGVTVSPVSGIVLHPAPAPKRDSSPNYIPKPFRIDPMKREQPEKE